MRESGGETLEGARARDAAETARIGGATETELCLMPAHRLAPLIRAGAVSPVDSVEAVLDRIAAVEPQINAFVAVRAEEARAEANRAEAAVMAGGPLGPLHGVTVTIKDLAGVAGLPTARGSHIFAGEIATRDAPFVQRLKAAGAIVVGKTTTPECGWVALGRSPLTGDTHNPWRHGCTPGGSSAGAAAAAAAGCGPLHQGTDAAGSIRIPAHFCGLAGLKPSYGRIPMAPVGLHDLASHGGPMARTVGDLAVMLSVMAGPHAEDHTCLDAAPADYVGRLEEGIAGKRIAYSPDLGHIRVDPEVAALVRAGLAAFTEAGAIVEEVPTPWGGGGVDLARFFWKAHFSGFARFLPEFRDRMDPHLIACIEDGMAVRASDYQRERERKYAWCSQIGRWFEDWDFLVTPTASVATFPVGQLAPDGWPQHAWDWLEWAEFSYPFNFTGQPAASVPCGMTADGRPVGLQIVGRRFDDLGVLQAAAAFEVARPWEHLRPPL
jgi:aspartyl-tRNA(Asn)/glutamyl-tRNA(Gln) amidotransferase subunit A